MEGIFLDQGIDKKKVKEYYGQEAKVYANEYREGYKKYPANLISLNFIVERLKQNKVKTVLDVGCRTCMPMIRLLKEGFDVKGIDFSEEMVREGKKELEKAGFDPALVSCGELENELHLPDEKFDAIIALGVFPHLVNDKKALENMKKRLNKNGLVFIEFRNDLFAAFTMNKYSVDFFLNRVIGLDSLPKGVCEGVAKFYSEKFGFEKPKKMQGGKISFNEIFAKFSNPLSIAETLFNPTGFSVKKLHFYHYHVLPPAFEAKYPKLFRELSLKMENPSSWKGYLTASAFVVEARKND